MDTVTAEPLAALSPQVSKCSHAAGVEVRGHVDTVIAVSLALCKCSRVGWAHGHSHRHASRPVSQSLGAREAVLQSPREEDRKQGTHLGGRPLTHQKEARPEGGLMGAGPP